MKVIFLDIDGVLNSEDYVYSCREYGIAIDPTRMVLLKQIIDETNAKIVLSTSWREHWEKAPNECGKIGLQINNIFSQYNLEILDKTPNLRTRREQEIWYWLNKNPQVKNFVVLDDMFLCAEFLNGHFIKTSNRFDGLDEADVEKAIEILSEGD